MLGYQDCFDVIASELDSDSVFSLGIKLKLRYPKVDEICKRNGMTSYEKIFNILVSWRNNSGLKADINQIITILNMMQKKSIADQIQRKLDSLK